MASIITKDNNTTVDTNITEAEIQNAVFHKTTMIDRYPELARRLGRAENELTAAIINFENNTNPRANPFFVAKVEQTRNDYVTALQNLLFGVED